MVKPEFESKPQYDFPVMFPATREVAYLLSERRAGVEKYGRDPEGGIPPAAINSHYENDYKWDNCFSAIFLAKMGHIEEAMQVLRVVIKSARMDGMIPNITYAPGARFAPEQLTFLGRVQSAYSQPTLEACALLSIIESGQTFGVDDSVIQNFSDEILPGLYKQVGYFTADRINRIDKHLIGLIHSNENGQDSSPTFDYLKRLRLRRKGPNTNKAIDYYNTVVDIGGMALLSIRNRLNKWETAKIFEYFCHLDPLMNVLFVNDLRCLATAAEERNDDQAAERLINLAQEVETAILTELWDSTSCSGRGAFRAYKNPQSKGAWLAPGIFVPPLRRPGFVDADTISCLFPIMLENLSEQQLDRLIETIEEHYSSPFMFPTTATSSREYDPHMNQKLMWRGPVWPWMNLLIGSGLQKQIDLLTDKSPLTTREQDLRNRMLIIQDNLRTSSDRLNQRQDFAENHDSETGRGLRTQPFAGSVIHKLVAERLWLLPKTNPTTEKDSALN